jgi:hypothetical protein
MFSASHRPIMRRRLCGEAGQEVEERYRDFLVEWDRVTETERMLSLVVGNTRRAGKLKNWKGFSKPNTEPGPKPEFFNPIMVYLAS